MWCATKVWRKQNEQAITSHQSIMIIPRITNPWEPNLSWLICANSRSILACKKRWSCETVARLGLRCVSQPGLSEGIGGSTKSFHLPKHLAMNDGLWDQNHPKWRDAKNSTLNQVKLRVETSSEGTSTHPKTMSATMIQIKSWRKYMSNIYKKSISSISK